MFFFLLICTTDFCKPIFFLGKVFVRGHYSNPECRVDYSKTDTNGQPVGGIKLSHGQCDMDRQRLVNSSLKTFFFFLV